MQYSIVFAMTMLLSLVQAGSASTNKVAKHPFVVRNIGDHWVTKVKKDNDADGDNESNVVPRGLFHNNVGRACVHNTVSGICNVFGQCELAGPEGKDKHGKAKKVLDANCVIGK
ncbi:uncharacterized protein PpBr36_10553 [Pyricularia pennisetigena]|uniref:uncharacterized protein n=1 Tax=Pyricularia pennisetigena TaxID=1578925 RepID=UPI001151722C|nr:uncharacterized protein PpBr36_10553 [Pyricularia pennisetigena]TLS21173.1 hypothetical protein PpBr36_10553 [Pyricularia pennisetigena]